MTTNLEVIDVREILTENKVLNDFILRNLNTSLLSIGFSKSFLNDLLPNLSNLDVKNFGEKWAYDLEHTYSIGFFQQLVPKYFSNYVVPATPSSSKILDVGCGTGILGKLYAEDPRFKEIVGIDIQSYPEWETFKNEKIIFRVVKEPDFPVFLKKERPDSIVITWTLHHMEYAEQERYLEYIYDCLKPGAHIIVLEDSYSITLAPENGATKYAEFMRWDIEERKLIMSVYDWVANRVLAQREEVPIPCAYRTIEEWSHLLNKKGFTVVAQKFIGFPDQRDIHTPQSLLIAQKR